MNVFQLPMNISSIVEFKHPVKVGLSDAFYVDSDHMNGRKSVHRINPGSSLHFVYFVSSMCIFLCCRDLVSPFWLQITIVFPINTSVKCEPDIAILWAKLQFGFNKTCTF